MPTETDQIETAEYMGHSVTIKPKKYVQPLAEYMLLHITIDGEEMHIVYRDLSSAAMDTERIVREFY